MEEIEKVKETQENEKEIKTIDETKDEMEGEQKEKIIVYKLFSSGLGSESAWELEERERNMYFENGNIHNDQDNSLTYVDLCNEKLV